MKTKNHLLYGVLIVSVLIAGVIAVIYLFLVLNLYLRLPSKGSEGTNVVEMARSRIQIGENREAAIAAMSDAWFHGKCVRTTGSIEDMFFYGPADPERAEIVMIESELSGGKMQVHMIGTLETPVIIHFYKDYPGCLPPQLLSQETANP